MCFVCRCDYVSPSTIVFSWCWTKHCHPSLTEIDDIMVDQMRRLGLNHLIVMSSMEIPQGTTIGSPINPKMLATHDSEESASRGKGGPPPEPNPLGKHRKWERPIPMVVCWRSITSHVSRAHSPISPNRSLGWFCGQLWLDLKYGSTFTRVRVEQAQWWVPLKYDRFLGLTAEEQWSWYMEHVAQMQPSLVIILHHKSHKRIHRGRRIHRPSKRGPANRQIN